MLALSRVLARPGGNATGFTQFEYSLSGKWLEMLKEVAPGLTRVGVLREAGPAGIGQWAIIQAVAQSSGVELSPINLRDASEIERAVTALARATEWRPYRGCECVFADFIAS